MGKKRVSLPEGSHSRLLCVWQGAQTPDAVENPTGVSRVGRSCISSLVLQTAISLSISIILLSHY